LSGRESLDRIADWITETFRPLPSNVRVVPPNRPINSYALMDLAQVGLVYASTVGLELAVRGVPVLVAGTAHYGAKGFTYEPQQRGDYKRLLARLMSGERTIPPDQLRELAERYAHLFFLRRTLPVAVLHAPDPAHPQLTYRQASDLAPGTNKALDVICDGILHGSPFRT
jgi:hypothetical protein